MNSFLEEKGKDALRRYQTANNTKENLQNLEDSETGCCKIKVKHNSSMSKCCIM